MTVDTANTKDNNPEFADFWENFQLLPWKWADKLAQRSRYLFATLLFVYAFMFTLTYFPDNPWIAPVQIDSSSLIHRLGGDKILFLEHYGSMNFIFIAMALVIMLVIRWRYLIPDFFQWLWDGQRLGPKSDDLKNEFRQYLQDYQNALKRRVPPFSIGLVLMVVISALFLWAGVFRFFVDFFTPITIYVVYVVYLLVLLWLFMVAQFIWALYVTSSYVGKLHNRFKIRIQPNHPDECGGLKPLGDFCIDGILPLIVMGILFAGLSIFDLDIDDVSSITATTLLFILVAPATALALFLPIWNIHKEMVKQKQAYEDVTVAKMNVLEKVIYNHTSEKGDLVKAKDAREKLEILRWVHPETSSYPVWPFRLTGTILTIFSPQIIAAAVEVGSAVYGLFK